MFRGIIVILSLSFCAEIVFAQGFTNIAEELQLDFTYESFDYGGGLSFVDFDQDGLDDLSFTSAQGHNPFFFRNTGNGFDPLDLVQDNSESKQLLWVDYNNDGLLDLYINNGAKNNLYKNEGDLNLVDVTESAGFDFPELTSYSATWFDYNNDGKLDLMVAHRTPENAGWVDLYRNVDYERFEKRTITAGLDNKGKSVLAMTIIDYNNDGWQDIFLGQDWLTGNALLKNNGNGTFKDVSRTAGIDYKMNSMTATVMDINRDGWPDLYVTNTTDGNRLFVNNTDGTFVEKASYYDLMLTNVTFGAVFIDVDNDGDDDLHVAGQQINYIFENVDGIYVRRNVEWGMQSDKDFNNGVAVGDLNGDGYIDIAKNSVTRSNVFVSNNSIWRNEFKENKYIKIQLKGTVSNINGIGALITVYTSGVTQMKRVACGESFNSQHSLQHHFGIGQQMLVDSVSVSWPSGNTSLLYDLIPNQSLSITEQLSGCMDINACNYSSIALTDNGNCIYPEEYFDCYGCLNDGDGDGVCDELEVYGCDDFDACNYSSEVTENDGSCYNLESPEIVGPLEVFALNEVTYACTESGLSKYDWTIENGIILAGRDSPEVKVIWYEKEEGMLSLRVSDSSDCASEIESMAISILPVQEEIYIPISIFPNPTDENLFFKGLKGYNYDFEIFDLKGRSVASGIVSKNNLELDLQMLDSGIYYVTLRKDQLSLVFSLYKS